MFLILGQRSICLGKNLNEPKKSLPDQRKSNSFENESNKFFLSIL